MNDDNRDVTDRTDHDRAGLVMVRAKPFNAETPLEALQPAATPTPAHFVRSNFPLPDHDGRLVIDGAVDHPATLRLDDLRALPAATLTVTLECAGNSRVGLTPLPEGEPWTGQAVGTARWTGARLADVLERVQPHAEGVAVTFTGADHGPYKGRPDIAFVRALPLDYARDRAHDVLLAYEMNGEPLTPDHGAPLRLITPGWYGMASVKWLARIEVRTTPYEGQFQTASYMYHWAERDPEPVTTMRVKALITDPPPGAVLPAGGHIIRGKAWSGAGRALTRIEVSIDAGEWQSAKLEPADGPYQWQAWSFDWSVAEAGRHTLRVRAIDAEGNAQPDLAEWNRLGYGNNSIPVVLVDVRP